ncbi:hypothetical protein [uncultured Methylobacterium sp.]|uniref:hypothetical protein n=1 Tax=uncultured Methylobacterium sp. TaxID=157278 RepID=UPI0035CA4032
MAADKLAIYNEALGHLGSRELASLSENRDSKRRLDQAWAPAIRYALEQAPWGFATRSVVLVPSESVSPAFGYGYAYAKPDDWLKTVELCVDARFKSPLRDEFTDEGGYWWTDVKPLFARYVSVAPAHGLDMSKWSPSFADYLAIRLAQKCCLRITGSDALEQRLLKEEITARKRANANDALNKPPAVPPTGSWVMARRGQALRGEGGSSGSGGLVSGVTPPSSGNGGGNGGSVVVDIDVVIDGGVEG